MSSSALLVKVRYNRPLILIQFLFGALKEAYIIYELMVVSASLVSVGWFSLGVVAVSAPAALGYLQDRCRGRTSEAELQRRGFHAVHRRDLQTVHLTKQEAMMEVKDL